jgi:hypothetical protein
LVHALLKQKHGYSEIKTSHKAFHLLQTEDETLYNKCAQLDFVMGITFMTDILREMSSLNVQFQRDHIDLTTIRQTIEGAVADQKDPYTADRPQLTLAGGENQFKNCLTSIEPQVRGLEVSVVAPAAFKIDMSALFMLKSEKQK